ncbi:MAG: hypothetical protein JEZ12_09385 [Desulfobacterium sp.]|nr:hypothetical protein [Desulfobacterium sp.]
MFTGCGLFGLSPVTTAHAAHTYTLVSGTGGGDNAQFTIAGDQLKTAATFDADVKSSYSIRVKVDDGNGGTFEKAFTISINDLPAPTATTNAAGSIGTGGATLNGTVNAQNHTTTVTFEYGPDTGYGTSVTADQSPAAGGGNTLVSKAITGLSANTVYHYRVKGVSAGGTTHGADQTFTTLQPATVTTQAATVIGTTTATGNGNITGLGIPNPTEHGVCWSTTANPTTGDSKTTEGAAGSTGAFTSNMTGLSAGTLYHYRAYATNTVGNSYGADVTFTTDPEAPTVTTQAATSLTGSTATGNGNITDLGAPNPTQHGVCWSTSANPTIGDSLTTEGVAGSTGAFTSTMAGLASNTLYHYRAYATNTAGTVYGGGQTFTTLQTPMVTTQAATVVATTTATGNGNITDLGSPNPTEHGVCWSTTANPTTGDSKTTEGAVGSTGAFTSSMTGLSAGTLYHVRAYATNTGGTSYGADITFTTDPVAPTVTTQAATSVDTTTATGNGNLTDLGAPAPTEHGVCWSTSANPTITDSNTTKGVAGATGAFTSEMTGLTPETTYHYRAYATNTAGTVYGADQTFTTLAVDLTVTNSNDASGSIVLGNNWTWTVSIRNSGSGGALFTDGQVILTDQLPDSDINYGVTSLSNVTSITNQGNINAVIVGNVLTVKASGGPVSMGGPNGRFDVNFTATPTGGTSFSNPRSGGTCTVDPGNLIIETNEGNNTPTTNTVTVLAPDLSVVKSNNKSGSIELGEDWTWRLSLKNTGNSDAVFTNGQILLTDDLPNADINYGAPSLINVTNITNSGNINLSVASNILTISASGGSVTLGAATGGFDVELTATPTVEGSFVNPRAGGICTMDPNTLILERDETNNTATDTVIVASLPTVTTHAGTAVTETTATGNGEITSLGSPNPTNHGVCWSTTANPTISDNKKDNGAGTTTGTFTAAMTGLSGGTTYHVRAFATNLAGTSYGADMTFTTSAPPSPPPPPEPEPNYTVTFALSGKGVHTGGGALVQSVPRGASANAPAVQANTGYDFAGWDNDFTNVQSSITVTAQYDSTAHTLTYSAGTGGTITGTTAQTVNPGASGAAVTATPGENYLFVNWSDGSTENPRTDTDVRSDISVTAHFEIKSVTLPVVTTTPASQVSNVSAVSGGDITDDGGDSITSRGVCWSTSANPTVSDSKTGNGAGTGAFSADITGLEPGITYHVRAYAVNSAGIGYGNAVSFTTLTSLTAPFATLSDLPNTTTNAIFYRIIIGGIGVDTYSFSLDNGAWSQETSVNQPLTFDLAVDGRHTLYVTGKNRDGIWQTQADATVFEWILDTTPPRAEVFNAPSGTVGTTSIDVTVGGADVTAYRYRLDKAEWSSIYPVSASVSVPALGEGGHTLEAIGADAVGNWQEEADATSVAWIVSLGVPTVALTGLPGTITDQTSVNITVGMAEGSPNVEAYYCSMDGGVTWDYGNSTEPIALTGLAEGKQTLFVNGFGNNAWQDGADGMTIENATFYQWRVDLTPADPAVLDLAKGDPASSTVRLSWRWSSDDDQETVQKYLVWYSDGMITQENLENATSVFCGIMPGSANVGERFTIDQLASGQKYYFAVKSVDAAGNVSALSNVAEHTTASLLPKITSIALVAGGNAGDNSVAREISITGANFLESADCNMARFENSASVFDVSCNDGTRTRISANMPEGAPTGTYGLRVINKNGISQLFENAYTVNRAATPVPEVTNLSPMVVSKGLSYQITITGSHFADEISGVRLVGVGGSLLQLYDTVRVDSSTIKSMIDVPTDFVEGQYSVQVINSDGGRNTVSAVKLDVCEVINLSLETATINTTAVVTTDDGVIPVTTTLTTDDRDEVAVVSRYVARIEAVFDSGTVLEEEEGDSAGWMDYDGLLSPPRQIPLTREVSDALGENSVLFTMGADQYLRLKYGKTMFVKIEVTMPDSEPVPTIYYVAPGGSITIAGVNGNRDGVAYPPGGTVLATRHDVPEPGMTTYTIGLVLDHMSTYVAGSYTEPEPEPEPDPDPDPDPGSGDSGGGGGCFIGTTMAGSFGLGKIFSLVLAALSGSVFICAARRQG